MAKTNPYNSRQTASLAFDDEQADEFARSGVSARARVVAQSRAEGQSATRSAPQSASRTGQEAGRANPRYADDPAGDLPLRARRRLPIRQSRWADFRWTRFLFRTRLGLAALGAAVILLALASLFVYRELRSFLAADPHFRIASSASIELSGADAGQGGLTRADLLSVFGSDIGHNIFFVPLRRRQAQLEQLPWVAHATVMRLLPDRLSVAVVERTPVAFVRLGSSIGLVDAEGVLLSLPPATLATRHYSFPVVTGLAPTDLPEARATRMEIYRRFVKELDSGGRNLSSQLSEVDLSDPEDVRVIVPAQGNDLLLHFGDSDFLARYRSYQAHLPQWRAQYPHLSAIDLRYERQVVLQMAGGSQSEADSIENSNTLAAAPPTAQVLPHPAHHPAGHGKAHGWRPR